MTISIITCMDENMLIGKGNSLPWFVPEDLKRFKTLTMGKSMIMGRKTFQSMGQLQGRKHLVLTKLDIMKSLNHDNLSYYTSIEELIEYTQINQDQEFMVIGGSEVYKQFLPYTDTIYLTVIWDKFEGDTYFPNYDLYFWDQEKIEHWGYYSFYTLRRK